MVAARLEGLAREIPIQIVRVRKVRILRELIPRVELARVGGAVADGVIRERLIERQRVRGARQPVEAIVAKALRPSPIRERRPISDGIVDIVGFVDLRAAADNLMQQIGDLTGRIVRVGRLRAVRQRDAGPARQRIVRVGRGVVARERARLDFPVRQGPVVQPHFVQQPGHKPRRHRRELPQGGGPPGPRIDVAPRRLRPEEGPIQVEPAGVARPHGGDPVPLPGSQRHGHDEIVLIGRAIAHQEAQRRRRARPGVRRVKLHQVELIVGRPRNLIHQRLIGRQRLELHQELDRERAGAEIHGGGVGEAHIIIDPIQTERLPRLPGGKRGAVLQGAVVAVLTVLRRPLARPPTDEPGHRRAARPGRARERREPVQRIVGIRVRARRVRERQPIAGLVVRVGQRHAWLIRGARGGHGGQAVGQIRGHREHTIGVRDTSQVADGIIRVAGNLTPRQRLAEELIHRVIGEADRLVLRGDPREQVIRAVVRVGHTVSARKRDGCERPRGGVVGVIGREIPWQRQGTQSTTGVIAERQRLAIGTGD